MPPNQTNRIYEDIGPFHLRSGKEYNYNEKLTPNRFEIVITTEDFELGGLLLLTLREALKDG